LRQLVQLSFYSIKNPIYLFTIMNMTIFAVYLPVLKFSVMLPTKEGQIVRFHTPLADEDPNQIYVVLELKEDGERSRADIQALGTGWAFPPVSTVLISDLGSGGSGHS
jgi:hypothetical protein